MLQMLRLKWSRISFIFKDEENVIPHNMSPLREHRKTVHWICHDTTVTSFDKDRSCHPCAHSIWLHSYKSDWNKSLLLVLMWLIKFRDSDSDRKGWFECLRGVFEPQTVRHERIKVSEQPAHYKQQNKVAKTHWAHLTQSKVAKTHWSGALRYFW